MYMDYFKLRHLPFENTPDPRCFFASEQHREALAAIEYAIRMRKGFVLITGEIGSGKTTVGRTMTQRCGEQATLITVSHGHEDRLSLLRQVLRSLGVRMRRSDDHARLLERVEEQATRLLNENRPLTLFIDEAQTLSDDALLELRLLSNLDTSTAKPVQVVLVGQPELVDRLGQPQHQPLRQRIVLAKRLTPLNVKETLAYIQHRLRTAAADPANCPIQFSAEAIAQIYQATQGVPRMINVVCDNCLLMAYVHQTCRIEKAMVVKVMQDMVPLMEESPAVVGATAFKPAYRLAGNF